MSLTGQVEASRQTTVLFADVTGSTKLYEAAGDALAAEAIGRCLEELRLSAEATGGRVVKTMGDSVMALFSSPDAAASAAARMQVAIESLPRSRHQARGAHRLSRRAGDPARQRHLRRHGQRGVPATRAGEEGTGAHLGRYGVSAPQLLRNSTRLLYSIQVKGKAEDVALCELVWRQSRTSPTSRPSCRCCASRWPGCA